jgi:hypothetical protein
MPGVSGTGYETPNCVFLFSGSPGLKREARHGFFQYVVYNILPA